MPIFLHRVFSYQPHKPRHPLLRLLLGLVGVALLALLVVFGLFIGLGMLLFAAVRRLFRASPAKASEEHVIDGEYSVVRKNTASISAR